MNYILGNLLFLKSVLNSAMYDYIYDLINMINSIYTRVPNFPHPVRCVYLRLGTVLLEYSRMRRRQEYYEYRRNRRGKKTWSCLKSSSPILALGIFGPVREGRFCLGYAFKWDIKFLQEMI